MSFLTSGLQWLFDSENWWGPSGIVARLWEHTQISILAVLIAGLIALPVGLLIGHTRKGGFVATSTANIGRSLPSFGILAIVMTLAMRYLGTAVGLSTKAFFATLIALVLLSIPPILANTYVGVQIVDAETVEAARGMGMSGRQVLGGLELPLAMPLIVAGLRTAAVAVVATATLGAIVSWGGLGRFIVDGFAQGAQAGQPGQPMVVGGAILVAVLAILTEVTMAGLERLVSPRTSSKGKRRRRLVPGGEATAALPYETEETEPVEGDETARSEP
jgi:osmoprotectant transport system permease protein